MRGFERLLRAALAAVSLLLVIGSGVSAGQDAKPLRVVFRDKPPYSYVENGVQKGFLLEKTRRIMARANIEANFVIIPPKRIFQELELNAEPVCSFGWYKIPAREKFALFSLPIHQDRPQAILTNPTSAAKIRRHRTLKGVMTDPDLVLAVAGGVSYGPELDAMIKTFAGKVDNALIPPVQVAKKVAFGRADMMFIDQDDYDYLMETDAEFRKIGMVRILLPDLPPGLKRYILCSRKVGEKVMKRIDDAIVREGMSKDEGGQ